MQPEQATLVALNRQLASLPVRWGVVGGCGGGNDFAPIILAALWLILRVTSDLLQAGAVWLPAA